MAHNPHYIAVLDEMREIHDRKNNDYADDDNPFSNFEGSARIAGVSVPQAFMVLIGVKVERLRQLLGGDKEANFESVDDTVLDLSVYSALLKAYLAREADGMISLNDLARTGLYVSDFGPSDG